RETARSFRSFSRLPVIELERLELIGATDYGTLLTDEPVFSEVKVVGGKLRVVRTPEGDFNLGRLFKSLTPAEATPVEIPTIRLSGVEVLLADAQQLGPQGLSLLLDDGVVVQKPREQVQQNTGLASSASSLLEVRLQFQTELASGLLVQGAISLDDHPSLLTARMDGLMLDERLLSYLPVDVLDQLPAGMGIRGEAQLAVQLRTKIDWDEAGQSNWSYDWAAAGVLSNGFYSDRRLPSPITDISGTVTWQGNEIRCERLNGRLANSPLTGSLRVQDLDLVPAVKATLHAENLQVDESLAQGLIGNGKLESVSRIFELYSPRGTTGLHLTYDSTGSQPQTDIVLDVHDMDITYSKFPYPFHKVSGRILVSNKDIEIQQIQAFTHGQRFEIQGSLKDAIEFPKGWIQITADGPVPLDTELVQALDSKTRRTIDVLRPTGLVWLKRLRHEYTGDKYNPQREIDIEVKSATVSYAQFPYPIHRIEGEIHLHSGVWRFEDFSGYKGNSYIQLHGSLTPLAGGDSKLNLELTGTDVDLDEELRTAFSVKNRNVTELWDQLQPQGALDHLTMKIEKYKSREKPSLYIRGKKWVPDESFATSRVQINPAWFPYAVDELTGEFIIQDGHVQLLDVRGRHDDTEFVFDAVSHFNPDGGWDLAIEHLNVDRLAFDKDLLSAVPESLSKGLKSLDLVGQLQLAGNMKFVKPAAAPLQSHWDLRVGAAGAALTCGPRFNGIYGSISFDGVSDAQGVRSKAWVDIDSMMWGDEQLTKLSGPVWVDSKQLLVGRWASIAHSKYEVGKQEPAAGVVRQPNHGAQSILARTAGGLLGIDLQLQFVDQLRIESGVDRVVSRSADRFLLQASLSGADLGYLVRQHDIKERAGGRINGVARLRGEVGDHSTWTGEGRVRLADADIYKLPLMVALLSKLGGNQERGAFSSSEVDFRIQSERFIMDRIALEGDAVSLYGNGWMSFDKEINMDFYSLVGRQRIAIPLLNQVVTEASKGLLRIDVAGSLDKPRVNGTAFPELDGTMERILHDLNTRIARPLPNGQQPLLQLR
ncbi:MAG: AsmA-like C-terminal region-containing protein, partial [Planctomycetota bacterium]|nr:AsmA-like C-terminal region-containing protein [Planctomycetota bacterium]